MVMSLYITCLDSGVNHFQQGVDGDRKVRGVTYIKAELAGIVSLAITGLGGRSRCTSIERIIHWQVRGMNSDCASDQCREI